VKAHRATAWPGREVIPSLTALAHRVITMTASYREQVAIDLRLFGSRCSPVHCRKGKARVGTLAGFSCPPLEGRCAMADSRALKLIGIMFAAMTLMVISTAAVVVAGHAAGSADGDYVKMVDLRD
jgi:hypothetical protein